MFANFKQQKNILIPIFSSLWLNQYLQHWHGITYLISHCKMLPDQIKVLEEYCTPGQVSKLVEAKRPKPQEFSLGLKIIWPGSPNATTFSKITVLYFGINFKTLLQQESTEWDKKQFEKKNCHLKGSSLKSVNKHRCVFYMLFLWELNISLRGPKWGSWWPPAKNLKVDLCWYI